MEATILMVLLLVILVYLVKNIRDLRSRVSYNIRMLGDTVEITRYSEGRGGYIVADSIKML